MSHVKWWCESSGLEQMTKAHHNDAGFDLCSAENVTVHEGDWAVIHTGLHIAVDDGYVARVCSRSGNSAKYGLEVGAGVVDAGYRGEVKVVLHNHSDSPRLVRRGDRIAQIVVHACELDAEKVDSLEKLGEGGRGGNGFGSTGN